MEVITATSPFNVPALLAQYGGFWAFVAALFGAVFVDSDPAALDVHAALTRAARRLARFRCGRHTAVQPAGGTPERAPHEVFHRAARSRKRARSLIRKAGLR